MTHFKLTVALPGVVDRDELNDALNDALAPFDEERSVASYRMPIENVIDKLRIAFEARSTQLPTFDPLIADAGHREVVCRILTRRYGLPVDAEADELGRVTYYTTSTYPRDEFDGDRLVAGARWDWYSTGPRSRNYRSLRVRPDFDLADVVDHNGIECDAGRIRALDLTEQRRRAADIAGEEYDWFQALAAEHPPASGWAELLARVETGKLTLDVARAAYREQSLVRALEGDGNRWVLTCPIDHHAMPRDQFVADASRRAVPGFATLTLDGTWLEDGRAGWFGTSDATAETTDRYLTEANAVIDALPPDAWLVVVDCHT